MRHLARLLCLSLLLAACSAPPAAPTTPATPATPTIPPPATLTVFAAASLTESFGELGQLFEARRPGVTVVFNFAGSQQLVQQLAQDAPADLFASANNRQMQAAVETGRVDAASPQTFVHNRLVVVTPADNRAGLASFADLARPGLKLVLAAPSEIDEKEAAKLEEKIRKNEFNLQDFLEQLKVIKRMGSLKD
ncbi:MAG TPA: molybdate ABC transporter substrate-binding protein, partial [Anaerolineae bacterium]|nr:molybdate ABC transporter substrate-binding protein [Anaerolineae bacterium]